MNNTTRLYHTVFISASKASCTREESITRTNQLASILRGHGFTVRKACGVTKEWGIEYSLEVGGVVTGEQLDQLLALGNAYQQDAVLSIDGRGLGFILNCKDGSISHVMGVSIVYNGLPSENVENYTVRANGTTLTF